MTTSFRELAVYVMLGSVPALARPAEPPAQAGEPAPQVTPPSPAPSQPPPAPPSTTPTPPPARARPSTPAPAGQWVYTQQYGWIWMTYGDAFVYVPPNGYGEPLEYVFYPSFGWTWIVAPWVWGIGPWPYFGFIGPRHFAWYGHGWWRSPSRWHFTQAPIHERPGRHGIRPPPVRGGRGGMGPRGGRHR